MSRHPKLRCPVCGMQVWLRNVKEGKHHSIDAFVVEFLGYKNVKHHKVTDPRQLDRLRQYWIVRLREVLVWLGAEAEEKTVEVVQSASPVLVARPVVKAHSIVSARSVLTSRAIS